ncbi:MAG TPA: hypothetical protein VFV51_14420 [Vicinamibacterales bacterium]|nr:hypothetical protein [Vicinamibacterales bacterium]
MDDQGEYPGRLIAIDGTRGKDVIAAADALVASLKEHKLECAISRFDASGLFGELAATGRGVHELSARTLALVYAADLAFRLRWEIRPALEAGGLVIAAPHIDTAIAIGSAHGLDEGWIRQLLGFAPKPHFRATAEERKPGKGWKAAVNRGYGEYCAAMLRSKKDKTSRRARKEALAILRRPRGRKVYRLADDDAADLAKAITGSLRAAHSRSASKPRSGRR